MHMRVMGNLFREIREIGLEGIQLASLQGPQFYPV